MANAPFHSFSQNGEDVVLMRAFRDVSEGRYIDVGANDPTRLSITRGFYDRGWSGITVEPMPVYAQRHREERPRDIQVEAIVTASDQESGVLHEIEGTGLSTTQSNVGQRHADNGWAIHDVVVAAKSLTSILEEAGWAGLDIHFMTVDVEGAEGDVLNSVDLRVWRPWVLVVEATEPLTTSPSHESWEPTLVQNGYEFCLFDGLSRFYVASEHAARLKPLLSYPVCVLDDFTNNEKELTILANSASALERVQDQLEACRRDVNALERRRDELTEQLRLMTVDAVRWRSTALTRWADVVGGGPAQSDSAQVAHLRSELDAMRETVSWKVTKPLRTVRARSGTVPHTS